MVNKTLNIDMSSLQYIRSKLSYVAGIYYCVTVC